MTVTSPRFRRCVALGALAVAVAGGCADDATERGADAVEESTTTAAEPSTTTAGASAATSTPVAPATGDAPEPTAAPGSSTSLLPASSGLPEVLSVNSRGEKVRLDETALLACANNQIAWVSLQTDDVAEADRVLAIAAARAEASAVPEVSGRAADLVAASEGRRRAATVDDFLELCVERGFEY